MDKVQEMLKDKIKVIAENYHDEPTGGWIIGDGPMPAEILFLGEAPGKTEIEEGKPFVGAAGKNFQKYLDLIGLKRDEVRITNSCFVRPIKYKEGKTGRITVSNRTPKPKEVELFREIVDLEIKYTDPKIIVTLGNVPLKRLTKFKTIGECHGQLIFNEELGRYIFPMYHPSSLIYNQSADFHKAYEEDWLKLKGARHMPSTTY
ncbi:DNA polymerase [Clostridium amylolyticum]|uniref:DNA polymerase n=1 Tax=Clostridium amylolyticum TaxID=1121298 RepID=A0A1M6PKD9_9CLOT|nr:uracil-DNA glycosylase [Clostridium amylolyticum]SHK08355.1 DNA polymerase [Clostridium amylolyticum]